MGGPPLCPYCLRRWYYRDNRFRHDQCGITSHFNCVKDHVIESITLHEPFPTCQHCGGRIRGVEFVIPANIPQDDKCYVIETILPGGQACCNVYRYLDCHYIALHFGLDSLDGQRLLTLITRFAPWRNVWIHSKVCAALDINETSVFSQPVTWLPTRDTTSTESVPNNNMQGNAMNTSEPTTRPSIPVLPTHILTAQATVGESEVTQTVIWSFYEITAEALNAFAQHSHHYFFWSQFSTGIFPLWLQICEIPQEGRRLGCVSFQPPIAVDLTAVRSEDFAWETLME